MNNFTEKKILLITNYHQGIGGISVQVEILSKKLTQEGVDNCIYSTKGNIIFRLFRVFNLLWVGRKFDVFHIHGCSFLGFYPIVLGVLVGNVLNKKLVITYHGGDAAEFFKKYPRFVRFILSKTDFNIVLSGFLGAIFDVYKIKNTIIPNILDVKKDPFIKREIIRPRYISVRTISELYNIQLIIDAFRIVKQQLPTAELFILGDGSCKKPLQAYVNEHEIMDVTFTGKIDNSEIYDYLAQADVFVSSPRIDNQPVSVLEAFNAGLIVISSNVGGVPYLVDDNKTGYLFESENIEELASKMIKVIENQSQSLEIINSAKLKLVSYSWSSIRLKLKEVYEK